MSPTPRLLSSARSPLLVADQAARDAVERHWAVKAIPLATRRKARVAAERAWEALGAEAGDGEEHSLARRVTKGELLEIGTLAEAYERAAHDARQAVLAELAMGAGDDTAPLRVAAAGGAGESRAMLRVAAAESFRLTRVLPLDAAGIPAWQAVRVAAFGTLGDVGAELAAFARFVARVLPMPPLPEHVMLLADEQRWDDVLRLVLPPVWLALLQQPVGDATEPPFEALGRLREMRDDGEARLLAELSATDAAHRQLALSGLYGLADAAATLVTHMRRTMPLERVTARLDEAFATARGTVAVATPLGRTLPWLQVAASLIARRQSAQIALPGLLA